MSPTHLLHKPTSKQQHRYLSPPHGGPPHVGPPHVSSVLGLMQLLKSLKLWEFFSYLLSMILPSSSRERRLSGILHLTGDQFIVIQSQDMKIVVRGNEVIIHTFHPLSIDVNGVGSDPPSDDVNLNERIKKITTTPICD